MHIDWWTLAIQAVNILVLGWLLARFLYRPLLAVIDRRRAASEKLLADARAAQTDAEARKAELERARAGLAQERDALLAQARSQIADERAAMRKQAEAESARLLADGQAQIARQRGAMDRDVADKASLLAVRIAQRLLERHPAGEDVAGRLSGLVAALPPHDRGLLAEAARAGELTIATASVPDKTVQRACLEALGKALGISVTAAFAGDPALIAGLEIRSPTLALKDNWRDDLARIREELKDDDGQQPVS